jgi:small subunit ribosomal protein S6
LKKYECLYIVNINFDSEGISAVVARVEEVLKNVGGEVVNTQHWGKRKLAYAIDKERYGNYVLMHFQGENPNISELAREFEIETGVLHYMTIRLDEFPDFETLSVPQAFEAERGRRPGGRDSREGHRPRRHEDDDDVDEIDEIDDDIEVEEVAVKATKAAEETPAEVAEVVEEAEEPAATKEEVEESADESPEEEAEKPADAE